MKLSDLLFRRVCSLCGDNIKEGAVCKTCDSEILSCMNVRTRIVPVNGKPHEARYLFDYSNDIVRKLLFALKRSANNDLFEYAAGLYETAVGNEFAGAVVCVPRRSVSKRAYGFDQVEMPCRIMCKKHKDRIRYIDLVKRVGHSTDQKNLTLHQRAENVKGVFRVRKKDIPENILLVDDVVTTGASVSSCAVEILAKYDNVKISFAFLASRN